ncbi:unnamed protein product, partial [Polarella glacialis]
VTPEDAGAESDGGVAKGRRRPQRMPEQEAPGPEGSSSSSASGRRRSSSSAPRGGGSEAAVAQAAAAAAAAAASRRPWGSTASKSRSSSVAESRSSGVTARGSSAQLLQAALSSSRGRPPAAPSMCFQSAAALAVGRAATATVGTLHGRQREAAAIAADDAMQALLSGFLSDGEDEEAASPEFVRGSEQLFGDAGMYSDSDSD